MVEEVVEEVGAGDVETKSEIGGEVKKIVMTAGPF